VDLESVRAAEEQLLSSAVRRDPRRVVELLHPDFVEIGRWGRRWSRDEIVAALSGEGERAATDTDEWRILELGPDLALVTYRIRGVHGDSRHSSIWSSGSGRLQVLFHQGTFVAVP
jgi:ribonuclease HI